MNDNKSIISLLKLFSKIVPFLTEIVPWRRSVLLDLKNGPQGQVNQRLGGGRCHLSK